MVPTMSPVSYKQAAGRSRRVESWRTVWRDGFVPGLTTDELLALRAACLSDDPRLVQGCTTKPPPLMCVRDWPCEAGCAIGFSAMTSLGTVGEVEERFARLCFEADERLGEPAACRWFLNWFDDTPRADALRELAIECELALSDREAT